MKTKVPYINKKIFFKKLVPYYEEQRDNILEILKGEIFWHRNIYPYKLAIVNNSETEGKFYFYISNRLKDHIFLRNSKPLYYQIGYSTRSLFDEKKNYSDIKNMLRSVFVRALLKKASIKEIFNYFKRLLDLNYTDYEVEMNNKYIRLSYFNLKLSKGLFAIAAFRANLIFPIVKELDSREIKDNTADNKKIIITNRKKAKYFHGFDEVLNLDDLSTHINLFGFTEDIQLYKDVTGLGYKKIFLILKTLKTYMKSDVFEMQKELLNLEYSRGNAFQDYLTRFLSLCFSKSYKKLSLKSQVSTLGNIRRRDFIITNHNSTNAFLKKLENRGVELLLFDAKNYLDKMSSNKLDSFRKYILDNNAFGNLGIIISRKGIDRNCWEDIIRGFLSTKVKILSLTQEDLLKMLDYYDLGRSPIDVIKSRYYEFLMKI